MHRIFPMQNTLIALLLFCSSFAHAQNEAKFANESELGVVIAGGNTRTQSVSAKQENSYSWSSNLFKLNARYLRTTNKGAESARTWSLGLRYERELIERLSAFLGQAIESDKFAGIVQRYNTDVGAKYFFVKEETLKWLGEAGYRYTIENKTDASQTKSSYGRLYTEVEKAFNASVSARFWIEYLPNFTLSEDYQANAELSLSALLNSIFSVKTAYLVRYDHMPNPGIEFTTDSVFTTALVAKF